PPRSLLFPYTTLFRSHLTRSGRIHAAVNHRLLELHNRLDALFLSNFFHALVYFGLDLFRHFQLFALLHEKLFVDERGNQLGLALDRKSTRLNSSHEWI